jgi:NADPH:quinone reductase-like Zn-dependent oxidoreductase
MLSLWNLPPKQSAIIAANDGHLEVNHNVPIPAISEGCLLVKVMVAALNPVDTKMVGHLAAVGATSGFDFSGVVVGHADGVKEWPVGTREYMHMWKLARFLP